MTEGVPLILILLVVILVIGVIFGYLAWRRYKDSGLSLFAAFLMFNGEVEQLGRAHGVATPLNAWLRREVTRRAVRREPPGGLEAAAIRAAAADSI